MPALLDDSTSPRSRKTLLQLRSRLRSDLGMTDNSLFSDTDCNDWFNEAQEEIARKLLWYRTSELMGTTNGTKEYALPIPVAGRCIRIEEVLYNDEQLVPVTLERLLQIDDNYRRAGVGTPEYYYVRGSSGFGLHVTPDTEDTDNLLVVFIGLPPEVTADNETFYVPHGCERGLLIYGKMMASEKDMSGEGQRRQALYEGRWERFLQEASCQIDQTAERAPAVLGGDTMEEYGVSRVPWPTNVTFPGDP